MNQVPSAQELAQQLLEREAPASAAPSEVITGAGVICLRLHRHFERLVGASGSDLLMTRAVSVARPAFPWLNGVRWQQGAQPGLDGWGAEIPSQDVLEVRRAAVAIVSGFLSLLYSFIGEELTVRQVHRLWPDLGSGNPAAGAGS